MSSFHFAPAKRENVGLLIGIAGGTGSGKTLSALRLATGLAGGKPFALIDTEAGRAKHYADAFTFDHGDLAPPFRPERYDEAIRTADAAGYPVIVVDSTSHVWEGDGGVLEFQEEEFQRMGARESVRMASWIAPKMAHRKMVTHLLQVRAHLILAFRAAEKVEMVKNDKGKMEVVPKQTLTGLDGWVPICERSLPFELTASFLLVATQPGVPKPIKLPEPLRRFVPLDRPLSEDVGVELGKWAAGAAAKPSEIDEEIQRFTGELLACADVLGNREAVNAAIAKNRATVRGDLARHAAWLSAQLSRLTAAVEEREQQEILIPTTTTEET